MKIADPLMGFIVVLLVVGVVTSVIVYFSFIYKTPVDFFANLRAIIKKRLQKHLNSSNSNEQEHNSK